MGQALVQSIFSIEGNLILHRWYKNLFYANEGFCFSSPSASRSEVVFSMPLTQTFPSAFLGLWRVACSLNYYSGFAALFWGFCYFALILH